MCTFGLLSERGHVFVEVGNDRWLIDTGAPTSFGAAGELIIGSMRFDARRDYLGLDAAALSQWVGIECVGLVGADVLGRFDHIFDIPNGTLTCSDRTLSVEGESLEFAEFMGIPILSARIGTRECRMFFDTGAQLSYFQGDALASFPPAGVVTDFYPGWGQFETRTHHVPISLGRISVTLRCGSLPAQLGASLMVAGTEGIIGNALMEDRTVGYFPRRRSLVLGDPSGHP